MPYDGPDEGSASVSHWDLEERLAQDQWGELWLARHQETGQQAVVRLLPPGPSLERGTGVLAEIAREPHEGIVPVLGFQLSGDAPYIAWARIPAQAVSVFLAQGPIPWENAVEIATQMLEALGRLHDQGLPYGLLRPEAVWVTDAGRVLLAEAGLHAVTPPAEGAADGLDAEMTTRGDVARLGAFLGNILGAGGAGAPEDAGVDTEPAQEMPGSLVEFIGRCRSTDPAARFSSCHEAHVALVGLMHRELGAHRHGPTAADAGSSPPRVLGEEEPAASPVPPTSDGTPGPTDLNRMRELERRLDRDGPEPAMDAELAGLRDAHGRAQLESVSALRGRAVMTRGDLAGRMTGITYVAGCVAGFILLWWAAATYLRQSGVPDTTGIVLTYVALAVYAGIGLWIAAALRVTRTRISCYAVVSDGEIVCRAEGNVVPVARIPAGDIRKVELPAFDENRPELTVMRVETWSGQQYTLDLAARAEKEPGH